MSHAATANSFKFHSGAGEGLAERTKVFYIVIASIVVASIISIIITLGVMRTVDNSEPQIQQHNNTTNSGSPEDSGSPAQNTDTPSDRVTPSPSGAGGNTMLNPEEI